MTIRNPLVIIPGSDPEIQELPAGDSIGGAAQGPVGMTWQGAWNSGTSYNVDDAVDDNGASYICILAHTNHEPPNSTYWNVLADKGATGTAATIAVGTVTTLAAGSSATVTNSGSSSAAVFDFGIPQGATGASGGGDWKKNAQISTTGTATSATFSSIPGTSTDMEIRWRASDTGSVGALEAYLSFNSDTTAANYTSATFIGTSSGTTSPTGGSGIKCMLIPGATASPSVGCGVVYINNYAGSNQKLVYVLHWDSTGIMRSTIFIWKSTAAITSVTVKAGNTAFVNGSIFSCDLLN